MELIDMIEWNTVSLASMQNLSRKNRRNSRNSGIDFCKVLVLLKKTSLETIYLSRI